MRGWVIGLCALVAGSAQAKAPSSPSLAALSGEVTVVAFWATWCAPCRHELPMVEALQQHLAGDARVRVVAVSVDDARDAAKARRLAGALGLTAPLLVDQALYVRLFGGRDLSVPRLAVVDRRFAGLERDGALANEASEAFVREVSAAVESVKTGTARPPSPLWHPYRRGPPR